VTLSRAHELRNGREGSDAQGSMRHLQGVQRTREAHAREVAACEGDCTGEVREIACVGVAARPWNWRRGEKLGQRRRPGRGLGLLYNVEYWDNTSHPLGRGGFHICSQDTTCVRLIHISNNWCLE
jgi:hypothetical protein